MGPPSALPARIRWTLLACALALLLLPLSGDRFWMQFVAKAMITGLFAMSLDLLVGVTGLVSLAHAAFFGIAGYLLAGLSNQLGMTEVYATLPLCLLGAGLAALAVGWLSLRSSGVYFIMVTLAFTQMFHYFLNDAPWFGGSDGLSILLHPRLSLFGRTLLDFSDGTTAYLAVLAALVLVYLLLARLLRAPFGRALSGIRANGQRMRSLGYPTRLYQLAAFVLAGGVAGLCGVLDASLYGFVNPAQLGWRESARLLVIVLLGGKGTLYGPVLGAFLLAFIEYGGERLTTHWTAVVAMVIVAVVFFLPRGVAGLLQPAEGRRRG